MKRKTFLLFFVVAASLLPTLIAQADPQQNVAAAPSVSNGRSQAPHICSLGGEYRAGAGWAKFAGLPCRRIYVPLRVYVGDRLRVRTPAEASAVRIRSVGHQDMPRPVRSCSRRAAGDWFCAMPPARPSDTQLQLEISYPDAFSRWSVDVAVRPRGRLVVKARTVDTGVIYTEGFVQCLAIRRSNSSRPLFHRCFANGRLRSSRALRPGRYRVASYTRSCSGTCENLDPPSYHCAQDFRVRAGRRLNATVRVAVAERCQITLTGGGRTK